jgi:hypothetical protein
VRRYVHALLFIAIIASCADSDSNSFRVVRDGEDLRYDKTTIRLRDNSSQTILSAWNTRDPIPDAADDEYSDSLEVAFYKEALGELGIEQDHPISGESSWDSLFGVTLDEVTFTADALHTEALESMLFAHWCFGCLCCEQTGSQTIGGTLRLSVTDDHAESNGTWHRVRLGRSPCPRPSCLHEFHPEIELGLVLVVRPATQRDVVGLVAAALCVGDSMVELDLPL